MEATDPGTPAKAPRKAKPRAADMAADAGKAAAKPRKASAKPRSGKASSKAVKAPKAPKAAPARKEVKRKLVRDSFTIPAVEYEMLAALKQRAVKLGHSAKKSELLRAGVKLLAELPDQKLLAQLANVPSVKTGRPRKQGA